MMHLLQFESYTTPLAYHLTFAHLLPSIQAQGLMPHVPDDMDDTEAVYLFKTREDAEEALTNWFGERMDELEEERGEAIDAVLLTVNITGLTLHDTTGYEWSCPDPIEPARIMATEAI